MFLYNFIKKKTPQKLMEKYDRYFGFIERVFNNIKWFFQRLFRGYSDYDIINYDREKNGLELFGKFVQGMWD